MFLNSGEEEGGLTWLDILHLLLLLLLPRTQKHWKIGKLKGKLEKIGKYWKKLEKPKESNDFLVFKPSRLSSLHLSLLPLPRVQKHWKIGKLKGKLEIIGKNWKKLEKPKENKGKRDLV